MQNSKNISRKQINVRSVLDLYRSSMNTTPQSIYLHFYITYISRIKEIDIPKMKEEIPVFLKKVIYYEENPNIKYFLESNFYKYIDLDVLKKIKSIKTSSLIEIMLNFEAEGRKSRISTTPISILNFIPEIYSISSSDEIADFFSGYGTSTQFLIDKGVKSVTSVEVSQEAIAIQEIKKKLLNIGNTYQIVNQDIFQFSENNKEKKYDFIFADMPWRIILSDLGMEWANEFISSHVNRSSSDWIFLSLIMKHLKKGGKAVVTVPNNIDYSMANSEVRKEFLEKGYIEKIIQLPNNLFYNTSIPSLLMVLSFDNESIEFIDATDMATTKGRQNIFTEEDVRQIMANDFTYKNTINLTEVLVDERLLPSFYTVTEINNYIELKEIAEVIRGQNLTRQELDKLIVDEVTGIELIRTSNIDDYGISDTQNLVTLPNRYVEVYDKDLLITRVSSSKNITIFEGTDSHSIIDQSLLIIRMTDEKISPYYILGFLLSDLGKEQLSTAYSSGTIGQVSIRNLEKVKIPMVGAKEQEKISIKIQQNISKIKKLKFELDFSLEALDVDTNKFFERGI